MRERLADALRRLLEELRSEYRSLPTIRDSWQADDGPLMSLFPRGAWVRAVVSRLESPPELRAAARAWVELEGPNRYLIECVVALELARLEAGR